MLPGYAKHNIRFLVYFWHRLLTVNVMVGRRKVTFMTTRALLLLNSWLPVKFFASRLFYLFFFCRCFFNSCLYFKIHYGIAVSFRKCHRNFVPRSFTGFLDNLTVWIFHLVQLTYFLPCGLRLARAFVNTFSMEMQRAFVSSVIVIWFINLAHCGK